MTPSPRTAPNGPQRAGAADRRDLQAAAVGIVRAGVPDAGGTAAARADRARDAEARRRGVVAIAGCARHVSRGSTRAPPRRSPTPCCSGSLLVPLGFDLRPPPVVLGTGAKAARKNRALSLGHAAARAPRRRAAAPDSEPAAPARSTCTSRRAHAGADAPRAVPRSADLAGDSWPGAGGARTLEGVHRSGENVRSRARSRADAPPPAPQAATTPATAPRTVHRGP